MAPRKSRFTTADIDSAPATLPSGDADLSAEEAETFEKRFIELSEKYAATQLELDELKRQNTAEYELNKLIKPMANRTFIFLCSYCAGVGLLILCSSIGLFKNPLNEKLAITLVGSTAATVIGLVGMVLTGIFVGARRKKG